MRRSIVSIMMLFVLVVLSGIVAIAQEDNAQANKDKIQTAIADYNAGNRDALYDLLTEPFMMNQGDNMLYETSKADNVAWDNALDAAMPDRQMNADMMIAQGEWVALHIIYTGTFTEPYSFIAFGPDAFEPTNAVVTWTETDFFHFNADGLIDQVWGVSDPSVLFGQLGIFPSMGDEEDSAAPLDQPAGYQTLSADELAATYASGMEERNVAVVDEIDAMGVSGFVTSSQFFADPFIMWNQAHPYSLSMTAMQQDEAPFVEALVQAMPDNTVSSDIVVAEGDWVAVFRTISGTFSEDFNFIYFGAPLPHTDQTITWQQARVYRFDNDGKIVEGWNEEDLSPLLVGLGMMPPMGDE